MGCIFLLMDLNNYFGVLFIFLNRNKAVRLKNELENFTKQFLHSSNEEAS